MATSRVTESCLSYRRLRLTIFVSLQMFAILSAACNDPSYCAPEGSDVTVGYRYSCYLWNDEASAAFKKIGIEQACMWVPIFEPKVNWFWLSSLALNYSNPRWTWFLFAWFLSCGNTQYLYWTYHTTTGPHQPWRTPTGMWLAQWQYCVIKALI